MSFYGGEDYLSASIVCKVTSRGLEWRWNLGYLQSTFIHYCIWIVSLEIPCWCLIGEATHRPRLLRVIGHRVIPDQTYGKDSAGPSVPHHQIRHIIVKQSLEHTQFLDNWIPRLRFRISYISQKLTISTYRLPRITRRLLRATLSYPNMVSSKPQLPATEPVYNPKFVNNFFLPLIICNISYLKLHLHSGLSRLLFGLTYSQPSLSNSPTPLQPSHT